MSNNQRKQRIGRKKPRRTAGRRKQSATTMILSPGPSLNYQKRHSMRIPGIAFTISSAATTGLVNSVTSISTALIESFTSRFTAFDEYRFVKVEFWLCPSNSTFVSPGNVFAFIDEDDAAAPTFSSAIDHYSNMYPCGQESSPRNRERGGTEWSGYKLVWRPKSFLDSDWFNTSTVTAFAYMKMFGSLASTFVTPSTVLFLIRTYVTLEFRGFQV